MRSASFIFLSVSLHVAALVYPVSFGGHSQAELIHVTILPMEREGGRAGGAVDNENPAFPGVEKSHHPTPPATAPRVEPKSLANSEPQALSDENVETVADASIALASASASSTYTIGAATSGTLGEAPTGSGGGLGGTGGGDGFGVGGMGSGRGSGSGIESGAAGPGIALTQARYRETPRPDYPESARRQGREGRVLVRVLVDDKGRSKQVEINYSSGSEALDRAAVEAIKRWRFHPARHGEKPIESWLRVPIEFRLTDEKSW